MCLLEIFIFGIAFGLVLIDALRREPDCASCREALRGLLWSAMPRPPGGFAPRADDAVSRRYLDALHDSGDAP